MVLLYVVDNPVRLDSRPSGFISESRSLPSPSLRVAKYAVAGMSSFGDRQGHDSVSSLVAPGAFMAAGSNDGPDTLTPLLSGGTSLAFPDKERLPISQRMSIGSLGLSDKSNSRGQQRSKSFKLSNRNISFRGPMSGALQSLSRNCSTESCHGDHECSSTPPSLKVFVSARSNDGKRGERVSKDTLNFLHEVAWKELSSLSQDRDIENRPPSPRPDDERSRVKLRSEVLESWNDSTRFRPDVSLAVPKYRRSDSRSDLYQAEQ